MSGLSACRRRVADANENPDARTASAEIQSCKEFVQSFYNWYFDQLNAEDTHKIATSAEDKVLSQRPEILTPELRQFLQEDTEASRKNPDYIVGLDFDPFINAQDWNRKYTLNGVDVRDGACHASLWGEDAGKQKAIVVPELKKAGDKWIFVNFHYPGSTAPENENLIAVLRMLREERAHPKHSSKH